MKVTVKNRFHVFTGFKTKQSHIQINKDKSDKPRLTDLSRVKQLFCLLESPVLARLQGMTDIPTTRSQTQIERVTTGWLAVILLKGYIVYSLVVSLFAGRKAFSIF